MSVNNPSTHLLSLLKNLIFTIYNTQFLKDSGERELIESRPQVVK